MVCEIREYEPIDNDLCECGDLFQQHVLVGDRLKCTAPRPVPGAPTVTGCCPCPDFRLDKTVDAVSEDK